MEGSTVDIVHRNATYWCSHQEGGGIVVSLTVEGTLLQLIEEEVLPEPTDCLCCYDVESTIVDLAPGEYTIEYCWDDYETTPPWQQQCHTAELVIP